MAADSQRVFVGRDEEQARFREILRVEVADAGQAILVTGHQGFGKSMLARQFIHIAENDPALDLDCRCVHYEVGEDQHADNLVGLMLSEAHAAAGGVKDMFRDKDRRCQFWTGVLELFQAGGLATLAEAWGPNPQKPVVEDFLEHIHDISTHLPKAGRVIFVIDSDKCMKRGTASTWVKIVNRLPPRVLFIFAQRPDDELPQHYEFRRLPNVRLLPHSGLETLDAPTVDELFKQRTQNLTVSVDGWRKALDQYDGHPYALQAALDLLVDGLSVASLPADPTHREFGIARQQWKRVCDKGKEAMRLLKAYAVLEVHVPEAVAAAVADLDVDSIQRLQDADDYIGGLLDSQPEGRRIYHSLLRDHIQSKVTGDELVQYHRRAVSVCRERLSPFAERQEKPDALAAERLSIHVRAAEGFDACVEALLAESLPALKILGRFHRAVTLLEDVREEAPSDSLQEAKILHELGLIYVELGDLQGGLKLLSSALRILKQLKDGRRAVGVYGSMVIVYERLGLHGDAERMSQTLLNIYEEHGDQLGLARTHGNLGLIQRHLHKWEKAEKSHRTAAVIFEKLGSKYDGDRAVAYHNLGVLCRVRNMWDEAEGWFNAALKIYKRLGDRGGEANCCGDLGTVCLDRKDYQPASELVQKSFDINKELGRENDMGIDLMNLGYIAFGQHDVPLAEKRCDEAIAIHRRRDYAIGLANCYCLMMNIRIAQRNLASALESREAARNLYVRMNMPREVAKLDNWLESVRKLIDKSEQ